MTTASETAQPASQGSSAWRLLAAVGLVLGATAFTVQSFVQSTGGEGSGPDRAAQQDTLPELEPCSERPLELTLVTEGAELGDIETRLLAPCELRPASAEG